MEPFTIKLVLFILQAASRRTTTSSSRTSPASGSKVLWTTRTRTARSSPTPSYARFKTTTHTHTHSHTVHIPQGWMRVYLDGGLGGAWWCSSSLASAIRHATSAIFPPSSPSVVSCFSFLLEILNVKQLQDRCWHCGWEPLLLVVGGALR